MGRENAIIQLKEDTQSQFAWDYEQENVRKLFNFNFAGGKRKIVLIQGHPTTIFGKISVRKTI